MRSRGAECDATKRAVARRSGGKAAPRAPGPAAKDTRATTARAAIPATRKRGTTGPTRRPASIASAARARAMAEFRYSRSARSYGSARRRRQAMEDASRTGASDAAAPAAPLAPRERARAPHAAAANAATRVARKRIGTAPASRATFEEIPLSKAPPSCANRKERGRERKRTNDANGNRIACSKNSLKVPCAASVAARDATPTKRPAANGIRLSARARPRLPTGAEKKAGAPRATPPPTAAAAAKSCLNHTVQPARRPASRARRRRRAEGQHAVTSAARTRTRPVSRDLSESVCVGRTTKTSAAAAAHPARAASRAKRNTRAVARATTPSFTARSTPSVAPKTRNAPASSQVVPGECRLQKSRYGTSPPTTRHAAESVLPSS